MTPKPCPNNCGGSLVSLPSTAERICSGCQKVWPWLLNEGQQPVGYGVCPEKISEITEK